jgi:AraC family transcriptional regulator
MFRERFMAGLAMNLYKEFKTIDDASSLAIEGLALEMTAWAMRYRMPFRAQAPRWLEPVKEILHEKFGDPLTISWIAEEVGVHPVYLGSAFRRYCGCGVGDYIRQLRVGYASRELTNSDSSLVEIGQASGFADQSHFSRTFKRLMGMTPARYRSLFRKSLV